MSDKTFIIAKIRKCLALAKSDNKHEAAIALRQAQRLMQEHEVSDFDIATADIQEECAKAGASAKPARWECSLAMRIAKAFGSRVFLMVDYPVGRWTFVGAAPSGEVARYAFEVMFRQIKRARSAHIKSTLRRCGPTSRTRRADLFCEGWVIAATALIDHFAAEERHQERVTAYLEQKHDLKGFQGNDRNAGRKLAEKDYGDLSAGYAAGKEAQLNHGVGGSKGSLALGGPA